MCLFIYKDPPESADTPPARRRTTHPHTTVHFEGNPEWQPMVAGRAVEQPPVLQFPGVVGGGAGLPDTFVVRAP